MDLSMTRDELDQHIDEAITARFERIGIYDQTPERLEQSRANNRLINDIRIARDVKQVVFRRTFREIMSSAGGQALWVGVAALAVWAFKLLFNK